jgi:hypothetical protein
MILTKIYTENKTNPYLEQMTIRVRVKNFLSHDGRGSKVIIRHLEAG